MVGSVVGMAVVQGGLGVSGCGLVTSCGLVGGSHGEKKMCVLSRCGAWRRTNVRKADEGLECVL